MLKSLQFIICSKIKKVNEVPRTEKQIETIITNLIYSVLLRADCSLIPDLVLFRTMQTVIPDKEHFKVFRFTTRVD